MPVLPGRALAVVVPLIQGPHIGQERAEDIVQRGHSNLRLLQLQQVHGDVNRDRGLRQLQAVTLGNLIADLPVPVYGMVMHDGVFVQEAFKHFAFVHLLISFTGRFHIQDIIL